MFRKTTTLFLGIFLISLAGAGSSAAKQETPRFTESLQDLLGRGDVVLVENAENQRQYVTVVSEIDAPPDDVWKLISNFDRYPDLFHEVEKVKVLSHQGNVADVKHYMRVDVTVPSYRYSFTLRFLIDAGEKKLTWDLVDGDLKFFTGSWELFPVKGGKKTIMTYRTTFDVIPRSYLARKVVEYISEKNPIYGVTSISGFVLVVSQSVKEELRKAGLGKK